MAIHAHSTTAPVVQALLLPLVPFTFRPSALATDPRSADELLEVIRRTIDAQAAPELPPEPLLPAADHARTIHLRRQLAQAADHGAALLASLGLPRLVGPDHIVVDPVAAGDALDLAIATLDALDGDTDLEDGGENELSLGWEKPGSQMLLAEGAYSGDRELDTADTEPSLASPERHPSIPLSFRGHAYTARGGDEGQLRWAEGAREDREQAVEDGPIDDDELDGAGDVDPEPSIGWPEDVAAEVVFTFSAEGDAEQDDCDLEDGDDDDRTAEDSGLRVWVFGPSRREVAHV